jgi:hypothetical protein
MDSPSVGEEGVPLLCASADRNPVHADFEFPDGFRRCQVVGKDQELRLKQAIMQDRFAPFEAKAYRVSY